jgi:hypothetical protein
VAAVGRDTQSIRTQLAAGTADKETERANAMDTSATVPSIRTDVVPVETTPRPTATPVRVHFSEILSGGARALVRSAQAAVRTLPGAPLVAAAVRGIPGNPLAVGTGLGGGTTNGHGLIGASAFPEGPGGSALELGATAMAPGVGTALGGGTSDGGLESSLAQSQEMNLYYLQIQQAVNDQNRTFTALSNVLEVEHNTAKSAISNIH